MSSHYQPVFQDANLSVLRLKGLSTPIQRILSLYFHLACGVVVFWVFFNSPLFTAAQSEGFTLLGAAWKTLIIMVVMDVVRRLVCTNLPAPSEWIRRYTLVGVIEDCDRQAYQACLDEIDRLSTRAYLPNVLRELATFEPELRRFSYLRLVALQRRGDLIKSLTTTNRVRDTGRLFYLMHLAEKRRGDADAGRESEIF